MASQLILSIEDDISALELVKMTLQADYEVVTISSAAAGLDWLDKNVPDLLLLDVGLSDGSGYEICEKIRSGPGENDYPIVFLSGRSAVEDRIRGYSAGGDEYLTKPISPDELKCKIRLLLQHRLLTLNLDNRLKVATQTAFTAMTNNSELGSLVKFTEECFRCEVYNELTQCLGGILSTFGLNGLFQLRTTERQINWSSSLEPIKPLEEKLLVAGREAPRICSHGQRTLFNSAKVTILIKNMPVDNDEFYGRLKDHLAIVLDVTESKLSAMIAIESLNMKKKTNVSVILQEAFDIICDFEDNFSGFKAGSQNLFQEMIGDVEDLVCRIGLSSDQEECLFNLLEESRGKLGELSEAGFTVSEKLMLLHGKIDEAIESA